MSITLPSEVVWFLDFIGIQWPDVNEDAVRSYATSVRTFASNVADTHQSATSTVSAMSQNYQGASYEQLVSTWTRLTQSHMSEMQDACGVVADAMDAAADAIVAAKVAAIAELVAMAASFVADQAAAVVTFGIAEAAEALIIEGAKKLINDLIQQLEQHILGEVLEKAVTPLEDVVGRAVQGLVYGAAEAAVGAAAAGPSFMVQAAGLTEQIGNFTDFSSQISSHANTFTSETSEVSFGG